MKAPTNLKRYVTLLALLMLAVLNACATAPTATPTPTPAPTPSPNPTPGPSPTETPPGYVQPESVDSSQVVFTSGSFNITAYLSRPKTGTNLPALIVIHENRGLTDHIRDVARRYANQGYAVLAPDLLSRLGGTGKYATVDEAVAAIGTLSSEGVILDLSAAFAYLQALPYVRKDRIGVLGYCWGGGNSLLFATRNRDLKAAVVYYGPSPANLDDVANITAPFLGIYGQEDTRITVNVPALAEAMRKYNKPFEYKIYPGAAHAFFNDTGTRYHAESAKNAWQLTIAFLQKHLKG